MVQCVGQPHNPEAETTGEPQGHSMSHIQRGTVVVVVGTQLQGGTNCSPMGHAMSQITWGADNTSTGAKTRPTHTMVVWQRIDGMVGFR